eukprot:PhM_4_TR17457/c1_g3_i1/m.36662
MQSTINVVSASDGKKYRMVMKGDLGRLSVAKLKKYLVSSAAIPYDDQVLSIDGRVLTDNQLGRDVGLHDGVHITLDVRAHQHHQHQSVYSQRSRLEIERRAHEDAYERRSAHVSHDVTHVEEERRQLNLEMAEREQRLRQLEDEERRAQAERHRVEQERRREEEFERQRAMDIADREHQLERERERVRALELQKLEVERKQQLLNVTRRDYHTERERLAREKLEFEDRLRRQELEVREKEILLERERMETDRRQKQIENEKALLLQQRKLGEEMGERERGIDSLRVQELTAPRSTATATSATPYLMMNTSSSHLHETPRQQQNGGSSTSTIFLRDKELELERLRAERAAILQQQQHRQATAENELDLAIAREREAIRELVASPGINIGGGGGGGSAAAAASAAKAFHAPTTSPSSSSFVPDRLRDIASQHFPPQQQQQQQQDNNNQSPPMDTLQLAEGNLKELARDLGVPPLRFDDNNTCVVSVEDKYTLLITLDAATERLFVYSTLLTFLPKDPTVKLKLYEFLLEGALLGRDMAGGGVGVSVKNDFILMATSIYLPKSSTGSLRAVVPAFVESLVKWRTSVRDVMGSTGATMSASVPGPTREEPLYPSLGLEITDGITAEGVFTKFADGVAVVTSRGAAQSAGIVPNDVIHSVNGSKVRSLQDFNAAVAKLVPNTIASFTIQRGDRLVYIDVRVGATTQRPGGKHKLNVVSGSQSSSRTHSPSYSVVR